MTTLTQFVEGNYTYTFPNIQNWNDNFGHLKTKVLPLPSRHGGFDAHGWDTAPARVGRVECEFIIAAATKPDMTALLDDARKMARRGKGFLFMQPADSGEDIRWCIARPINIAPRHDQTAHSDLFMHVSAQFEVDDPHWYVTGGTALPLWDTALWGSFTWDGSLTTYNITGVSSDIVLTNTGNAPTLCKFNLIVPAAKTAENVTIQRILDTLIVDEVSYQGTLSASDNLVINPHDISVTLNSADAFTTAFSFLHPRWFLLLPGANTVRILQENAGDEIDVIPNFLGANV